MRRRLNIYYLAQEGVTDDFVQVLFPEGENL
jgi:hypothetical protein